MKTELSRFKNIVAPKDRNKGMQGVFFDAITQKIVATNGYIMLTVNAHISHTKLVDLNGNNINEPYVYWKGVVPSYFRGVNISVIDLLNRIHPYMKMCKKYHTEHIGIKIDDQIKTYDSKLLYHGLQSLKSKTATLFYDVNTMMILFHTTECDLFIMPTYVDSDDTNEIAQYFTSPMRFETYDKHDSHHFYHAFGGGLYDILNLYKENEFDKNGMKNQINKFLIEISELTFDERYTPYLNNLISYAELILKELNKNE